MFYSTRINNVYNTSNTGVLILLFITAHGFSAIGILIVLHVTYETHRHPPREHPSAPPPLQYPCQRAYSAGAALNVH